MKHIKTREIWWTNERGYRRGVLLPYGNDVFSDIQSQIIEIIPGEKVGDHKHFKQTELIYIVEGSCIFLINGEKIVGEKGDQIIILPKEPHSTENIYDVTCRFFTVKINGSMDDTIWNLD